MSESITEIVRTNMKRIRKDKGFIQEQVADLMGIPASHYNRIELGKVKPGFPTVEKIATALDVPYIELFMPLDTASQPLLEKLKRLEDLPDTEFRAVEAVINMALQRHQP